MASRQVPLNKSVIFLGPPETGKSSILTSLPGYQMVLYMDLEDPLLVQNLLRNSQLMQEVLDEVNAGEWLTINRMDRIAKYFPMLKSAVQNKKIFIAATVGSLHRLDWDQESEQLFHVEYFGAMNFSQIQNTLNLNDILAYGTLPKVYNTEKPQDKIKYLKTYLQDFLDLDLISQDQVRNLVPFHLFLPLAAAGAGKNINYSALAQELDVDYKTIQNYFDLLVNYHVGFYLPPTSRICRKVQTKASRFYFFDPGFQRTVEQKIDFPLIENSPEYSQLFKSWCIKEIHKRNAGRLSLSYLETKDGSGVDLLIERSDGSVDVVIFLTVQKFLPKYFKSLRSLGKSIPQSRLICVTHQTYIENQDDVEVINYKDFLIKDFVLL